ncbi:exodeoxyribonuclease VII large subunit [Ectothiorhodospiraceae bacterium 2226]|nr:exodeoxyribonuclease VII large subunit [Ectothiorhodospiraceae bacterium 2226]
MNQDREPWGGTPGAEREILRVSQLNRNVRLLLEGSFPLLWVEGEISNLARPASGHLYFTLKDAQAQVRCAMFRTRAGLLSVRPENGMQVVVRARISIYEPRGDYQLIVEHLEEAGDGALQRAFEQLKQRLAAEGLFATELKRPLPRFPRRVGVITSPTGAAIRDVLAVLRRRFPTLPVVVYPVPVQGTEAPAAIVRAIETANARGECDVLILTRGGGSLEDLWAFNEERVARAVRASELPIVCGVGHEIDVTIADFAADQRAPTPSAAAELVSPERAEWAQKVDKQAAALRRCMVHRLAEARGRAEGLRARLRHPGRRLQDMAQRLDELHGRMQGCLTRRLALQTRQVQDLALRLQRQTPRTQLLRLGSQQAQLATRLQGAVRAALRSRQDRLMGDARALEAVSPLATLGRGYAIVQRLPERTLVRTADQLEPGARVEARFGRGRATCTVEEISND